ncbi:cytochrome c oxidase subunit 3 [Cytophagaceae bacterium YF14B1]|uniref:Cytochrome c oxidase subunit 3 n=1 Tax=Xanthocytophaga flava TaxID=3048013 RepID=A0AAE3QL95_9BACT|nr:cytochrome c oxidase subunit 3 [Xanthocytophaga flavus]MDJ1466514.1 cytochrome c oxidase subunit 3 [Xanthocytophaga flavus]MDJ1479170.1 cytochrome c oxidase subunit 3 [Xanthocytophaga flavus]
MSQKIEISGYNAIPEEPQETLSMNPKKFALWLFIVSIIMIFAAMSSAYIVRKGDGNWLEFELPQVFWTSSVIILLSSITMQWAHHSAKKDNLGMLKISMVITFLLGVAFIIAQYMGWQDLQHRQIWLGGATSNPAGSFLYIMTGLHIFHLVTGIVFLLLVLIATFRDEIHAKAMNRMDMCTTYWHFLDFLWVYLFIFLLINH